MSEKGRIYTSRLHIVRCLCGEEENDADTIGDPMSRREFEEWLRKKAGWSQTVQFGWMCPYCREAGEE